MRPTKKRQKSWHRLGRLAGIASCAALLAAVQSDPVLASYGFYVGKNLTEDGSVLLGGKGEEVSGHPQVAETYKYITMDYSDYEGFPAPLTNGGMNEHQVAARDIWSPSRDEGAGLLSRLYRANTERLQRES